MHWVNRLGRWLANPLNFFLSLLALLPIALVTIYITSYRLLVPFVDEWYLNGPVAIATVDGKLTPQNLLFVAGGHRVLFTNIATVISTVLTNWDLRLLSLVSLIAALILFGLLLLFLRRTQPEATALALVPISLTIFAVYRDYSWWSVRFSHWTLVNTFFAATLWLVYRERLSWRCFVLAMVLGWCATYTSGIGMLVWPLVVVMMALQGNRKWGMYAVWCLSAAASILLYVSGSGVLVGLSADAVNTGNQVLTVRMPDIAAFVEFSLKFIGSGMSASEANGRGAMLVAVLGLALFVVHLVFLLRSGYTLRQLAPWVVLAGFGLGADVLVGLGRIQQSGADQAFKEQYVASSSMFWLAVVVLMVLVIRRIASTAHARSSARALLCLTLALAVVLLSFYVYTTADSLQSEAMYWGRGLRVTAETTLSSDERCVVNFVLTRKSTCLKAVMGGGNKQYYLDELAVRRIGLFATLPESSLLPESYQPHAPILLATTDAWLNVHIRDLLLAGVDETAFYHLVNGGRNIDQESDLPHPLRRVATDVDQAVTLTQSLDSEQVWLVQTSAMDEVTARWVDALAQQGYVKTSEQEIEKPLALTLLGFTRSQ